MQRSVQLVYILFFSVLFGASIRSASVWKAFPTWFFRLPDRDERRQERRRFLLGLVVLNIAPFMYFAVTVYFFGRIHQDSGWLMLLDYFAAPVVAMALPGFTRVYQGLVILGGRRWWPSAWAWIRRDLAPLEDPRAHIIPGLVYIGVSIATEALVLAL